MYASTNDETTEQFRTLYNEKVCDLYNSPTTVRAVKYRWLQWAEHVQTRNAYRILMGKYLLKRPPKEHREITLKLC
jgi:hypothetical protein